MATYKPKTQRYRAGQAPSFMPDAEVGRAPSQPTLSLNDQFQESAMDRRMQRLAQSEADDGPSERSRRRTHRAEVVVESEDTMVNEIAPSAPTRPGKRAFSAIAIEPVPQPAPVPEARPPGEDMELDEEYQEERRARLKNMQLERQEAALAKREVSEDEDEYEEEEEDEEEEEYDESPVIRPTFVKKSDRSTLKAKEEAEKEKLELEAKERLAEEARRAQTVEMMANEDLKEEEAKKDLVDGHISDIEKEDDPDEEYELWKIRELKRLKRDREAKALKQQEREEVERRRHMTDAEVMRERHEENGEPQKLRTQFKHMQRGYSKGAFYEDQLEELSKTHNWNAPTADDNWFNRTTGPESLRNKRYGKAGKQKHIPLHEQDTSRIDTVTGQPRARPAKSDHSKFVGADPRPKTLPVQRSIMQREDDE